MGKIINDKYYTSPELAKYCVDKVIEIIGSENITEYLEPSAGGGVFLNYLDRPFLAYDTEPNDDRVVKQDYLMLELGYLKGRCVIGNPPFGRVNWMSVHFYKKSLLLGDYIGFILPISQLNNNMKMYEFNMVHSEDLGVREYSDRKVHCCFNIYKRPIGELNKPPKYELKDVKVIGLSRGGKYDAPKQYDFGMCTWGSSCGKPVKYQGQYAQEHYIVVKNPIYKNKIIKLCEETDWGNLCVSVASPKLQTWRIYKYIKEQIPEIL